VAVDSWTDGLALKIYKKGTCGGSHPAAAPASCAGRPARGCLLLLGAPLMTRPLLPPLPLLPLLLLLLLLGAAQAQTAATKEADEIIGCEGDTVKLSCKAGTIDVISASYGRHHGGAVCKHPATSNQKCHATQSLDIVRAQCQGKTACAVKANNKQFGDPCGGTFKYLTAKYRCTVPGSGPDLAECMKGVTLSNTVCCARPGDCVQGKPKVCSAACAQQFLPFYATCSATIARSSSAGAAVSKEFHKVFTLCEGSTQRPTLSGFINGGL
jgi:hypothetical protein